MADGERGFSSRSSGIRCIYLGYKRIELEGDMVKERGHTKKSLRDAGIRVASESSEGPG